MCPTVCDVHHPEWRATRIACNPARSCPPPRPAVARDKLRPQKRELGMQESRKNSSRIQLYPGAAVFTILDSGNCTRLRVFISAPDRNEIVCYTRERVARNMAKNRRL